MESRIRPIYPTASYTDRDWEVAGRQIACIVNLGKSTFDVLERLTGDYAAQQDAMGNRDSRFIPTPVKHFDHAVGKWGGPFVAPVAAGKPVAETAMDRIYAATSRNDRDDFEAIEHAR